MIYLELRVSVAGDFRKRIFDALIVENIIFIFGHWFAIPTIRLLVPYEVISSVVSSTSVVYRIYRCSNLTNKSRRQIKATN